MVDGLTNSPQNPHTRGGEIFMEEKGDMASRKVEQQPRNLDRNRLNPSEQEKGGKLASSNNLAKARKVWEENYLIPQGKTWESLPVDERQTVVAAIKAGIVPVAGGAMLGGQPEEELGRGAEGRRQQPIFANIPLPEQPVAAEALRRYQEEMQTRDRARLFEPERAFDRIWSLIESGTVDRADAQDYINEIARIADERQRMRVPEHRVRAQEIQEMIDAQRPETEIIDRLKEMIDSLNPDEPMDVELLRVIARYEEPSAKFLDRIISKPFDAEGSDYRLSFYAEINLQAFLTQVKQSQPLLTEGQRDRYLEYVRLHETALRFHQMNKTLIAASGNINAFIEMTRSVNASDHLDTLTKIDGVEIVRQLLEIAYARTYSETDIIDGKNFRPKIINWVERKFRKLVADNRVKTQAKDARGDPLTDAQGNPIMRDLEEWEIRRALAFGRYIHSSFYRHSELISWHRVPDPYQGWLQSFPTETAVRAIAGFKWLSQRFKIGEQAGGLELIHLIQKKLEEGLDSRYKTQEERRGRINKLGKLDIKTEILPVGLFRGGGFDKGWRTFWSYLSAGPMTLEITDDILQQFPQELRERSRAFINQKRQEGEPILLGEFLAAQEFVAQALSAQKVMVKGYKLPERYSPWDENKQRKLMEGLLLPLLGLRPKPENLAKIARPNYKFDENDFDYNPNSDQINLNLGVMIEGPVVSEMIKTRLWEKVADFLPLRIAHFLSEEGVKGLTNYNQFRGTGTSLFSEYFEDKLIVAQRLRLEQQKQTPQQRISLTDNFLIEAGMTPPERQFVRDLQSFGKSRAAQLAKISFPHIPFLEDVPFQNANYIVLGDEVFPRRMGSDFQGYYEGSNALAAIFDNVGQPYQKVFENLHKILTSIASPEGRPAAQNVTLPIFESYLQMGEQWGWTKWPFIKSALNFLNMPVSHLQKVFGGNANAYDESDLSLLIREAAKTGLTRFSKLPHEESSQMQRLLKNLGAEPRNVLFRELRNAIVLYLMFAAFAFIGKAIPSPQRQGA